MDDRLKRILPDDAQQDPDYLGEGVYASHDGFQIVLCTLEGSLIFLEPSILAALERYRRRMLAESKIPEMKDHPRG